MERGALHEPRRDRGARGDCEVGFSFRDCSDGWIGEPLTVLLLLLLAHRIAFSMSMPYHLFGELDFTYGIVATYCLIQAECAVFIIAQSIPVIRVMLQSGGPSPASRLVSSVAEPDHGAKGKQPATAVPAAEENIELVQLASGKIVRADSEEGWAHRAAEEQHEPAGEGERGRRLDLLEPAGVRSGNNRGSSLVAADDEVHRIWMELGLSKRAWSQSPDPVAAAAAGARL